MRMRRLIFVFLMAIAAIPAGAQKSSADAPHVHVQLVKGYEKVTPSASGVERNSLGLYFKLEKGWHIYWKNAGDAGESPRIHWTLPDGVSAEDLEFPAPKRLPIGPLMDYGYEDEVIFPIKIVGIVPKAIFGIPGSLKAHVTWIVCSDSCIPGKADLQTDFFWKPDNSNNTELQRLEDLLKKTEENLPKHLPSNSKAIFASTKDGFLLSVETGQRESSAVFFPAESNLIDNPAPQRLTPTAKGFQLQLKRDQYLKTTPAQLPGLIELSGGRNYEFVALPGVVAAAPNFNWLELARVAGLAFLGGILLNLMPCVFPVLFLKGLALVNSGHKERQHLRAHGAVYAAGIVVSFWALVAVLLILRGAGAQLGWGFQFQSPVFLSLMAGLLFFLGLSLAGQFEIGLTLTGRGGHLAAKEGFAGSFFTGVLAVVVATPCAAPFMGAAVGYALAQSALVSFVIFTALALGLAAPYVALTLQPAWTRVLPRPGVWMDVLKQATAIPIFGTAIWLVWVVASTYGTGVLLVLLVSFLLLAVAGWFLGRWPAKRWATIIAVLILVGIVVLCVIAPKRLADATPTTSTPNASSDWQPWSADAVAKARAAGEPVFVDFTAKWCLSCQVNERVALEKPEVRAAFEKANVVKFKADWTQHDDAIANELTSLGRDGVPVYALYKPGASEPELLPEALTPGIVLDALGKISK